MAHASDGKGKDRGRGVLAAWIGNVASLDPESMIWPAPARDRNGRVTESESAGIVEEPGCEANEEAVGVWAQ